MNKCNKQHFDGPSFWAGTYLGIVLTAILILLMSAFDGYQYTTGVPDACQYAEDLCYPEYENGKWSIVEGER